MTLLSSKVQNLFRKYPDDFMRDYRGCSDLDCLPGCNISNAHCERIAVAYAQWCERNPAMAPAQCNSPPLILDGDTVNRLPWEK